MVYLIDTNILVRLITGDIPKLHQKALQFFEKVENNEIKGLLTESIIAEVYYVLKSFYKFKKEQIIEDLQAILSNENILYENKSEIFETFSILKTRNLSFVDALLCAKSNMYDYTLMSFDKNLLKCSNG